MRDAEREVVPWMEPSGLQLGPLCLAPRLQGEMISRAGSVLRPGLKSGCHLLAAWPLTSYLTSLCLSFLIFKMGIIVLPLQGSQKD